MELDPQKLTAAAASTLSEDDYYMEDGLLVFTAAFHLKRGYCCGSGCRHCPYEHRNVPGPGDDQRPDAADAAEPDAG
jgi:hypothetical protein